MVWQCLSAILGYKLQILNGYRFKRFQIGPIPTVVLMCVHPPVVFFLEFFDSLTVPFVIIDRIKLAPVAINHRIGLMCDAEWVKIPSSACQQCSKLIEIG